MAVLQDLSKTNGKAPAIAELQAQLEALKLENAKLKEGRNARISFKVSSKGAISLYGLGRFPVTLYSAMGASSVHGRPDQGIHGAEQGQAGDQRVGHGWASRRSLPICLTYSHDIL
jgi:hypothetical protein